MLEEDGWVRRYASKTDRRITFVELSEEGRKKFSELLGPAWSIWSEIWSGLEADEKTTLARILRRLRADLLTRYLGTESLLPYNMARLERKDALGDSLQYPD